MNGKFNFIMAILVAFFIAFTSADLFAAHRNKNITPYGAYCKNISRYGMHKFILSMKRAEAGLRHYYGEKGVAVEILSRKGRFIKAHVKKGDDIVDTVLFDRRTGRLRSVY